MEKKLLDREEGRESEIEGRRQKSEVDRKIKTRIERERQEDKEIKLKSQRVNVDRKKRRKKGS